MIRYNSRYSAIAAITALVLSPSLAHGDLLVELDFDETGTSAANSGTLGGSATLLNSSGSAADLHSAAGAGVSGNASDRAFDNSGATAMGGSGGVVRFDDSDLIGLNAFTVSGWFKADATYSSTARLFQSGNAVAFASTSATIAYKNSGETSDPVFTETGEWVFFAVTQGAGSDNINFFKGTLEDNVSDVGTQTTGAESFVSEVLFGNRGNRDRAFDGLLDNIRIHDTVLNTQELESLRASDVPEPGSIGLCGIGLALIFGRRRR